MVVLKGYRQESERKSVREKAAKKKSNLFLGKSKQVLSVCYSAVPLDFLLLYHLQPVFNFTYILGNIQLIQKSNQMVYMVSKKNFFQFHPDPFSWYSSQTFGIFFNCFQCSRFMIIRFFCYSSIKPAQINFLYVITDWEQIFYLLLPFGELVSQQCKVLYFNILEDTLKKYDNQLFLTFLLCCLFTIFFYYKC